MSSIKTVVIVCALIALSAALVDFTFKIVYNEAEHKAIYERMRIPEIPANWRVAPLNTSEGCAYCKQYGWRDTVCVICWDGLVNAIRELQFLIYWLDLLSVVLIFGLFFPRPSELLYLLGKTFPQLSPFINWFLLFPAGDFPHGPAWCCWLRNLFYLFEVLCAPVILYPIYRRLRLWQRGACTLA